jgi:DNA repair protein RecO (recombination protein O)
VAALGTLEEAETPDVLARAFELHAMSLLGYEPRFHECVVDEAAVGGPGTGFHPLRGGLVCPRCARMVPGTLSLLPETLEAFYMMGSEPLQRLAHASVSDAARRELERCLIPYVRHHLGVELRTLEFLDGVTSQ